jgi:hypothetical protein
MDPEDAKEWDKNTEKHKDKFKAATIADEEKESRFEEGKPADPTKHMDPEDAKEWKAQTEEHKDEFKSASAWKVAVPWWEMGVHEYRYEVRGQPIKTWEGRHKDLPEWEGDVFVKGPAHGHWTHLSRALSSIEDALLLKAVDWWLNAFEHAPTPQDAISDLAGAIGDTDLAKHMWQSYERLPSHEQVKFLKPDFGDRFQRQLINRWVKSHGG